MLNCILFFGADLMRRNSQWIRAFPGKRRKTFQALAQRLMLCLKHLVSDTYFVGNEALETFYSIKGKRLEIIFNSRFSLTSYLLPP